MTQFAQTSPEERTVFIREAAARLGVHPVIIEKDFWVTWGDYNKMGVMFLSAPPSFAEISRVVRDAEIAMPFMVQLRFFRSFLANQTMQG